MLFLSMQCVFCSCCYCSWFMMFLIPRAVHHSLFVARSSRVQRVAPSSLLLFLLLLLLLLLSVIVSNSWEFYCKPSCQMLSETFSTLLGVDETADTLNKFHPQFNPTHSQWKKRDNQHESIKIFYGFP